MSKNKAIEKKLVAGFKEVVTDLFGVFEFGNKALDGGLRIFDQQVSEFKADGSKVIGFQSISIEESEEAALIVYQIIGKDKKHVNELGYFIKALDPAKPTIH